MMLLKDSEVLDRSIHTVLEKELIIQYLEKKGYRPEDLLTLNPILAKDLMTAASMYASLRLAEVESRSRFVDKIQHHA